jgi:hypothetical protein
MVVLGGCNDEHACMKENENKNCPQITQISTD